MWVYAMERIKKQKTAREEDGVPWYYDHKL